MKHHCHAVRCDTPCPPAMLMCARHWSMVPRSLQAEVHRTVKLRARRCDSTWAPWWRAQERAISGVALAEGMPLELHDRRIARADAFAETLIARDAEATR